MDIHKAVKTALWQRRLTQTGLARLMQVSPGCVHQWVAGSGSMHISTITRIAEAIGMKTSELIALGEDADSK